MMKKNRENKVNLTNFFFKTIKFFCKQVYFSEYLKKKRENLVKGFSYDNYLFI